MRASPSSGLLAFEDVITPLQETQVNGKLQDSRGGQLPQLSMR